ncbi:MAG TPA: hypothetical protein VGG38_16820 [Acidimicrobiales bacterium]
MLGFFSFTEITDPSGHRAYNEWHHFDHLPEQFTIEGITFGQRWVCSPRCVEARVAVSPLLAPCHYMRLYFLRGEAVRPEFFDLAGSQGVGRGHPVPARRRGLRGGGTGRAAWGSWAAAR